MTTWNEGIIWWPEAPIARICADVHTGAGTAPLYLTADHWHRIWAELDELRGDYDRAFAEFTRHNTDRGASVATDLASTTSALLVDAHAQAAAARELLSTVATEFDLVRTSVPAQLPPPPAHSTGFLDTTSAAWLHTPDLHGAELQVRQVTDRARDVLGGYERAVLFGLPTRPAAVRVRPAPPPPPPRVVRAAEAETEPIPLPGSFGPRGSRPVAPPPPPAPAPAPPPRWEEPEQRYLRHLVADPDDPFSTDLTVVPPVIGE
ncbi:MULTISPECIES: hypothetical protein [unclassified Crossiella]|uniref:hypothetical protein n=1 Tax=unclassified Crossiella TaxID=2620835 RepID=UPI001FFEC8B6|nr:MULTISPECIES: hypothetical protein [unclassified Crossiella]MCK2237106.1 hypothetical protein [Crossiella sp. S99.2]MCK2250774.1 hypothetical protein [Crossiella sp. S99.1]